MGTHVVWIHSGLARLIYLLQKLTFICLTHMSVGVHHGYALINLMHDAKLLTHQHPIDDENYELTVISHLKGLNKSAAALFNPAVAGEKSDQFEK